jgi:hypothetical protein
MAAQAESHSTPTAPDYLLIEMCQRADVLGKAIDGINSVEPDEDRADEQTCPLHEKLATIQVAIVNMPARSTAGVIAKAHCVAWCRAGDLSTEMDGPGMDFEMMMSMVRDLLAIEAKGSADSR